MTDSAQAPLSRIGFVILAICVCLSQGFSSSGLFSNPSETSLSAALTSVSSEEEMVRKQLGYLPTNFLEVSGWKQVQGDQDDQVLREPLAIKTYPLNGGAKRRQSKAEIEGQVVNSPFPTLYWLTCPEISKAVADLERRGFLQSFEEALEAAPELTERLLQCHEEYARERWATLTKEDQDFLSETHVPSVNRMRNMMKHSGISGTNFTVVDQETQEFLMPSIKCLHAHYAYYRSTMDSETLARNPVGEMIHAALQEEFPDLKL